MAHETSAANKRLLRSAWVALQLLGFAATSYWLHVLVQSTPGFDGSQLAATEAALTRQALGDLPGALWRNAILPGVVEELLFRGAVFAVLARLGGRGIALAGSALLFGAAHFDLHHSAVATLLGLQLGLIRIVSGLGLAVVAHVSNNALALLVAAIPPTEWAAAPADPLAVPILLCAIGLSGISCATLVQSARSRRRPGGSGRSCLQAHEPPVDSRSGETNPDPASRNGDGHDDGADESRHSLGR